MKDKIKAAILRGLEALQKKWPPEAIAKALSPVFVVAAGALCAWVADHFPGLPTLTTGEVTGLFGLGVVAATAKLYKIFDSWTRARQLAQEATEAAAQRASDEKIAAIQTAPTDHSAKQAIANLVTTPSGPAVLPAAGISVDTDALAKSIAAQIASTTPGIDTGAIGSA